MTIQVTVANAYGLAMASDRHIYRHGQPLSTGRQPKLTALRAPMPAAMMTAGSFSVLGFPLSRVALGIERALATPGAGPDVLAERVLDVLDTPLRAADGEQDVQRRDIEALARTAEFVVGRARAIGDDGIAALLVEIERAPRCRGGDEVELLGRAVWQTSAGALPDMAPSSAVAELLQRTPDLLGEAVIGALVRDWTRPADANLMVGLCCPETGVPVVVAVNIWKGLGNRLLFAPRHDRAHFALHQAGRSLILSQGSGRRNVTAMLDGCSGPDEPDEHRANRWQRAHERIAVSSPDELAAVASGLVRGAEVIGYLTGEDEGSVVDVDCIRLTPSGLVHGCLQAELWGRVPDNR